MSSNSKITAVVFSYNRNITDKIVPKLSELNLIKDIIIVSNASDKGNENFIKSDYFFSGETIRRVIEKTSEPYLLFIIAEKKIDLDDKGVNKIIKEAVLANKKPENLFARLES